VKEKAEFYINSAFMQMEGTMTIIEAIGIVNTLKPNSYTELDKIGWLSEIEGMIKTEIIDTHEGGEKYEFNGYNKETNTETSLLISEPHDDIYIKWLEAKIDYNNAEYAKYNNSMIAFNNAYSTFERYYNRHHMPIQRKLKFF
jgi:hypothetical protein